MDDSARKALKEELSDIKHFHGAYSQMNRLWFIDTVVRMLERLHVPDDQLQQKTRDVVLKSKAVVAEKSDIHLCLFLDKKRAATERAELSRRVEILYGTIALNPDFLDPTDEPSLDLLRSAFLDFIAKRRYRSVERMALFVNPNALGFFRYPYTCKEDQRWRINEDARDFWEVRDWRMGVPIVLPKPDTQGNVDFLTAIRKLFITKRDPCAGNLLDCETTLCVILLDSLLEARDPAAFLKELDSRSFPLEPHSYLRIYRIVEWEMPLPDCFFALDSRARGLFTAGDFPLTDVQVGDHVYIGNHPFYAIFGVKGVWHGIHCLLADRRYSKDVQPSSQYWKDFIFIGHGMQGTVFEFYSKRLQQLQTLLHRAYRIGLTFLQYKHDPANSSISRHVTKPSQRNMPDALGNMHTTDIYFFDIDFTYPDYEAIAPGRDKKRRHEHGFVVMEALDLDQFAIHHQNTVQKASAEGVVWMSVSQNETESNTLTSTEAVIFARQPSPALPGEKRYDPLAWTIPYRDPATDEVIFYDLFIQSGRAVIPRQLTMGEMRRLSPFAVKSRGATKDRAYMTVPKVDLSESYLVSLKSSGAI